MFMPNSLIFQTLTFNRPYINKIDVIIVNELRSVIAWSASIKKGKNSIFTMRFRMKLVVRFPKQIPNSQLNFQSILTISTNEEIRF